MTKLITAEEARAMSDADIVKRYMYRIDRKIREATKFHLHSIGMCIEGNDQLRVTLTTRLRALGYYVQYKQITDKACWLVVSW